MSVDIGKGMTHNKFCPAQHEPGEPCDTTLPPLEQGDIRDLITFLVREGRYQGGLTGSLLCTAAKLISVLNIEVGQLEYELLERTL